jgi:preprotein translocase subunit SecG
MFWIISLLTLVLILDSAFLILLILVQLPKKEAGLGQAFGSAATDALFGAGSGNALTKLTKYATVMFFALTLSLSVLNAHEARGKKAAIEQLLQRAPKEAPATSLPLAEKPAAAPAAPVTVPGGLLSTPSKPAQANPPPAKPTPEAPAPAPKPQTAPAPNGAK